MAEQRLGYQTHQDPSRVDLGQRRACAPPRRRDAGDTRRRTLLSLMQYKSD